MVRTHTKYRDAGPIEEPCREMTLAGGAQFQHRGWLVIAVILVRTALHPAARLTQIRTSHNNIA